ncbi:MAG TPA: sialidase family protein [Verrucomicrobiae bacterium]|nr:sialidase family protein [Verrucomicrobiae bacterium]
MKTEIFFVGLGLSAALLFSESLHAQGTAFTYQGRLNDGGSPANNSYNLTFTLFNASSGGSIVAGPLTNSTVPVANGLFTTTLDFGNVFNGNPMWLEIGVTTNGGVNFVALSPRQQLTPAPYAITASNVTGIIPSGSVSGTYVSPVTFNNSANQFSGSGVGLTALNASQLSAGTVADARLSANVALLSGNQTFNGANNFTSPGNNFTGSFFGNGLVGWVTVAGTTVQAASDTGYLLTSLQNVKVTLPASPQIGDIVRISGAGAGGWQVAQNANQSILGNFSSFAKSSWTLANASAGAWSAIASSADGNKWVAAVFGGGIYISTDAGFTWNASGATSSSWRSVASSADGGKLVATVTGGSIYTNSGTTWNASLGSANWYSVASSADGSKLVAVISNSTSGGIYTSSNSGGTWSQTVTTARNWVAVASSADGGKLAAAVFGNGIYTSANWSQETSAGNRNWTCIASSADGTRLVAAVSGGIIYSSSDSGTTWTTNNVPVANWTSVASSADGSKLAAVANGGHIYISDNWGATWTQQTNTLAANWASVAASADGSKFAAAISSTVNGSIYLSQASSQTATTTGTNGYVTGAQGSAVELQYIGNNQFMPVSSAGTIWGH